MRTGRTHPATSAGIARTATSATESNVQSQPSLRRANLGGTERWKARARGAFHPRANPHSEPLHRASVSPSLPRRPTRVAYSQSPVRSGEAPSHTTTGSPNNLDMRLASLRQFQTLKPTGSLETQFALSSLRPTAQKWHGCCRTGPRVLGRPTGVRCRQIATRTVVNSIERLTTPARLVELLRWGQGGLVHRRLLVFSW